MAEGIELVRGGKLAEGQALQRTKAKPLADQLERLTNQLVNRAESDIATLVDRTEAAYRDSRRIFIAVAAGGIGLALLLGFAISWSIIGPVTQMGQRFDELASGDFSRHVEVVNRDELGVLAVNLNRMNDELGRLYRDLEAASRHKSEFLASMSHELRTPLNAIIGFSEVLREEMFGPLNERQADYLNDILTSGRHLLSLINDILDLSKIEAGKMELELSTFSLPGVLEGGLTMIRERAVNHGISLGLDVAPDVGEITADERKVKQVVFNLLSNAVKFTPDGGRIDLAARCSEGEVEVSVTDTGIGIAPDDHERGLRRVPAGGPARGFRPRLGAQPEFRRTPRRTAPARKRTRCGQYVRIHTSVAQCTVGQARGGFRRSPAAGGRRHRGRCRDRSYRPHHARHRRRRAIGRAAPHLPGRRRLLGDRRRRR